MPQKALCLSRSRLCIGLARRYYTVDAPETAFAAHTRSASPGQGKAADKNAHKKRAAHKQETMGSPPKFNIKKVKKRKEEGSPRQKERDELLRSKEARMAAIRRANNIRRSVRNQIVAQLVATPASPAKSVSTTRSSPTRSP